MNFNEAIWWFLLVIRIDPLHDATTKLALHNMSGTTTLFDQNEVIVSGVSYWSRHDWRASISWVLQFILFFCDSYWSPHEVTTKLLLHLMSGFFRPERSHIVPGDFFCDSDWSPLLARRQNSHSRNSHGFDLEPNECQRHYFVFHKNVSLELLNCPSHLGMWWAVSCAVCPCSSIGLVFWPPDTAGLVGSNGCFTMTCSKSTYNVISNLFYQ